MSNNWLAVLVYQTEPPYNKPHMYTLEMHNFVIQILIIESKPHPSTCSTTLKLIPNISNKVIT